MAGIVGIDVGGTFTDLFFSGGPGRPHQILKVPSTPQDPSIGLLTHSRRPALCQPILTRFCTERRSQPTR